MRELIGGIAENDGHGLTQLVGLCEDIGIKEDFANDAEGESRHLLIHVDACPIAPLLLHTFSVLNHDISVGSNLARLKGGSHQFALSPVELSLADEDAVALDGIMHRSSLVKVIGMLDKNAMDMFRPVEQNDGKRPKVKAAHIPIFLCQAQKEVQAILIEGGKTPYERKLTGKRNCPGRLYLAMSDHRIAPL
jgi:hypothetical protein